MKRLIVVFLILALTAWPAHAATFSDDFTRGDNADIGDEANWDTGYNNDLNITSNRVRSTVLNADHIATYTGTIGNDQSGSITLATLAGSVSRRFGVALRFATPATLTGYLCIASTTTNRTTIGKFTGGSFSVVNSEDATTWAQGDVLRCEVTGAATAVINLYRNGALVLTGSDASSPHTSGRVGMFARVNTSGALTDVEIDDFSATDELTGLTYFFRRRHAN